MAVLAAVLGIALVAVVLIDGFETMVLPRRVMRTYRPAGLFYGVAWTGWRTLGGGIKTPRYRETFLSVFGPLSLLTLFATWVLALIIGFSLVHWALDTPVH